MYASGLDDEKTVKDQIRTSEDGRNVSGHVLVLGIGGSPRPSGNSEYLVKYTLERVAEKGEDGASYRLTLPNSICVSSTPFVPDGRLRFP